MGSSTTSAQNNFLGACQATPLAPAATLPTKRIGFIGGGSMATSLISGLVSANYPVANIFASDPNPETCERLNNTFCVRTSSNNEEMAAQMDVLVLCVKPQLLREVLYGLASIVKQRLPLIISVAIGISQQQLCHWLQCTPPVIRVMPNTPALIKKGASGLFANSAVTQAQKDYAEAMLSAVGVTVWVTDEHLLEVIGALSGSGPAYYFLFLENMIDAAVELGLPPKLARLLATHTADGAASMALASEEPLLALRERVMSKGGTTERAIAIFEQQGLRDLVHQALQAAVQRSEELAATLAS